MTAAGQLAYELTFTRVGRTGNGAPLTLAVTVDDGPAAAVADQISEAAYKHARRYVVSRELEVFLSVDEHDDATPLVASDLDGCTGTLLVGGFRPAGEFRVREVTVR